VVQGEVFVGEIDLRFEVSLDPDQPGAQVIQVTGEVAEELVRRLSGAFGCAGTDQVDDRFGLRQVKLAVEEGALGELARPRRPGARPQHGFECLPQDDRAAVAVQLENVLSRVTVRRAHEHGQRLVDELPAGADRAAVVHVVCLPGAAAMPPEHHPGDRLRGGAADPDHADASDARRRCNGSDRLIGVH